MPEPQTWYQIRWDGVEAITVLKETDKTVTYEDRWRQPTRMNKHKSLFRTKAEADAEQLNRCIRNVEALKVQLAEAEKELEKAREVSA